MRARSRDPAGRGLDARRNRARVEADVGNAVDHPSPRPACHPISCRSLYQAHRLPELGCERRCCGYDADLHLVGQGPAGRVVGLLRRSVGALTQVGIRLHAQQLPRQLGELLVHRNHPGSPWIIDPVERDIHRQLPDPYAVERQPPQQLNGCHWIALLLWNEVRVGRRVFIFADRVAARLVAVVEQVLLVLRRVVQNRYRSGEHVLHRISQSPPAARPGTRVQRFGAQVAAVLRKVADRVEVWRCVAVQRRLRPKRHDVLQHREVIDVAGIPRVEARAHVGGADLAVCLQRLCDRHPDGVDLTGHQGRDLRRDRLCERR